MKYSKDDLVVVEIIDMSSEGEGIGKADGFPFFIKDSIIGDIVKAKVVKVKKNYAYARLVEIIEPSKQRCEARCDVARQCGGCQIQAMSYDNQLRFKENKVKNNLMRLGGISKEELEKVIEPIAGMENPWNYRNKAQYPVSVNKEGKIIAGFYAGRTHSVIESKECVIGPTWHKTIIKTITSWMENSRITPYDEKTKEGQVRHILIRDAFTTKETMVVLVMNVDIERFAVGSKKKELDKLIESLSSIKGINIKSIQLNENRENTNVILGRKCKLVFGEPTIKDVLLGNEFNISPLSFYQVNPIQTEKLYGFAKEFAELDGTQEVWDICCGIGTITLCVSDKAKEVHGIEIVPQAIEDAKINAVNNGIENVDFICAAAEEYMPEHKNDISADVIITDPPRKGMDESALDVMVLMNPKRIVYVSCDSATLARDIKYLIGKGYNLKRVKPVDMFPHSVHVETVVLLSR